MEEEDSTVRKKVSELDDIRVLRKTLLQELVGAAVSKDDEGEERASRLREWLSLRVEQLQVPLNRMGRERAVDLVLDDVLGFGLLERWLRNPDVDQIQVTGPGEVRVTRNGVEFVDEWTFDDDAHLARVIERMVGESRRARTLSSVPPHGFRGTLSDGSLFEATLPPLALASPTLTILLVRSDS